MMGGGGGERGVSCPPRNTRIPHPAPVPRCEPYCVGVQLLKDAIYLVFNHPLLQCVTYEGLFTIQIRQCYLNDNAF